MFKYLHIRIQLDIILCSISFITIFYTTSALQDKKKNTGTHITFFIYIYDTVISILRINLRVHGVKMRVTSFSQDRKLVWILRKNIF